jgi:DNA-binding LacI/PurR family transcriptional regulator
MAFTSSRLRQSGYCRALHDAGLEMDVGLVANGVHSRHHGLELAHAMLTRQRPPTAIVCASDTQAAGALEAAASLGLSVPLDVSVVGYDDLDLAVQLHLTTVRQPLFDSGVRAVQKLLVGIEGKPMPPLREVQPIRLVVRESTAPPIRPVAIGRPVAAS